MTQDIISAVSDYYAAKIKKFGNTPQGVDWNSDESQALRFLQLCKILPQGEDAVTLLDYGCGYGALNEFLTKAGKHVIYSGFDASVEMIEASKEKFQKQEIKWFTSEHQLSQQDYVIASGIFNVKMDFSNSDWLIYVLSTLDKINALATKGFAFNVLTSYSDKKHMKDNLFYADPCFLFDYCKRNFARNVALLHDYQLYEFSILIKK